MAAAREEKIVDFLEYRRRQEVVRRAVSVSAAVVPVVWGYAWVPMVMVYPMWPVA